MSGLPETQKQRKSNFSHVSHCSRTGDSHHIPKHSISEHHSGAKQSLHPSKQNLCWRTGNRPCHLSQSQDRGVQWLSFTSCISEEELLLPQKGTLSKQQGAWLQAGLLGNRTTKAGEAGMCGSCLKGAAKSAAVTIERELETSLWGPLKATEKTK